MAKPAAGRERLTGLHPVREALRARRRSLARLWIRKGSAGPEVDELRALARQAGVAVEEAPAERRVAEPGERAPLFVLEVGPLPAPGLEELLNGAGDAPCLVALDGVEDPQNLGAVLRVADGAGCAGALLPLRRAAPPSPAVSRASAGALEHLPVARVPNLARALEALKKQGFWVVGADLEGGENLFSAPDAWLRGPLVVVLGAEGRGIRPGIRARLDHRLAIPMAGQVASLNVATAAAVLLYELQRRRGGPDPGRPGG